MLSIFAADDVLSSYALSSVLSSAGAGDKKAAAAAAAARQSRRSQPGGGKQSAAARGVQLDAETAALLLVQSAAKLKRLQKPPDHTLGEALLFSRAALLHASEYERDDSPFGLKLLLEGLDAHDPARDVEKTRSYVTLSRLASLEVALKDDGSGPSTANNNTTSLQPPSSSSASAGKTSSATSGVHFDEVFPESALVSACVRTPADARWIASYCADAEAFRSHSTWQSATVASLKALTWPNPPTSAVSATTSTSVGSDNSPGLLAGVLSQLLVEIEGGRPWLRQFVQSVLEGVYVFGAGGRATNDKCRAVCRRDMGDGITIRKVKPGSLEEDIWTLKGKDGYRKRLEMFLGCPTWYDAVFFWEMRYKRELELQPYLERMRKLMAREKQIEEGVLNRTCTAWTKPMMVLMLHTWRQNAHMDQSKELLGKYFLKMAEIKPSFIFAAWKKYTIEARLGRADTELSEVKMKIELKKAELGFIQKRVQEKQRTVVKMQQFNLLLKEKLDAAMKTLRMPARQPPTLRKLVNCISNTLKLFKAVHDPHIDDCAADVVLVGVHTMRFLPLYKWTSAKDKLTLLPNYECDKEDDFDPAIESAINKWAPGMLPGAEEFTHAFLPGNTRAGRRIQRWVAMLLKQRWTRTGTVLDKAVLGSVADGGSVGLVGAAGVNAAKDLFLELSKFCPGWSEAEFTERAKRAREADVVAAAAGGENEEEQEEHIKAFHEKNPCVRDCRSYLKTIRDLTKEKSVLGLDSKYRFIVQSDFSLLTEPESQRVLRVREGHLKQAQQRNTDSGIVVNVFSQYMGRRVPIIEANVQKRFAFFIELFFTHFEKHQVIPGATKWHQKTRKTELEEEAWAPFEDLHGQLAFHGPTHFTHEELLAKAAALKKFTAVIVDKITVLHKIWVDCLADRKAFREFCPNANRLAWQSLCTIILSRKVREEMDIDDGTYTAIDRLRLAQEFKRLDIYSGAAITEDIDGMRTLLKGRIRDLKRIFQFYAAADEGDATSMDQGEFKRFVRDTKMQKDRQLLPSVRIDLIYQATCMDLTKQGRERIDCGIEDLDAKSWVESLVRIACYKYEKGCVTNTMTERLEKLLINEVFPNACSVDVDVFRSRIDSDLVREVFAKNHYNLKKIFEVYSADDVSSDDAVSSSDTMNVGELVSFGRAFTLIGAPPLLSERAMKVMFAYVQQEDPDAADSNGNAVIDDNSEMVLTEFTEALAAVGAQLFADPYLVLDMKLHIFLRKNIMPVAFKMDRFRRLGPYPKGLRPLEEETQIPGKRKPRGSLKLIN